MSTLQYFCRKLHNLTHPVLGRILMLHRVVEHRSEDANRELEVTPQFLEQTINDYCNQGYRFVSIDKACAIIANGRSNRPFVCLTFDDGYRDTFDLAYPLLKKLDIPFVVYVTTGFADDTASMWWYGKTEAMNWEQIKALDNDPLCTIGAHTVSHPRLSTLAEEETRKEIVDSKRRLEEMLGHSVNHFSYPHGDYNTTTLQVVNEAGFTSALKAWGGSVRKGDATLLELPRIELKEP